MFASVQHGEGEAFDTEGRYFAYYTRKEFLRLFRQLQFEIQELWFSEDSLPDRARPHWMNAIVRTEQASRKAGSKRVTVTDLTDGTR